MKKYLLFDVEEKYVANKRNLTKMDTVPLSNYTIDIIIQIFIYYKVTLVVLLYVNVVPTASGTRLELLHLDSNAQGQTFQAFTLKLLPSKIGFRLE